MNALNARARAVAIATGTVTGPDLAVVATRSASTRGQTEARSWRAGDVLIAKRNDTRIAIGAETLPNGDRFRVLAASDTGGLVVADVRGRGTLTLPGTYLARHAEYGWAPTIDGAQGATADIGIVLARSGLDREHLYVAMSRGRLENHVHTTPELATGDAGPHHSTTTPTGTKASAWPGPRQPHPVHGQTAGKGTARPVSAGQLALPDIDAALAQLARAVATSGRERAAHALLDPAVQAAREVAWARNDAAQPREIPPEHQRHRDALEVARARHDSEADRVAHLRSKLESRRAELERVPFWARKRRTSSATAVRQAEGDLDRALTWLGSEDATVSRLAAVVGADTTQTASTRPAPGSAATTRGPPGAPPTCMTPTRTPARTTPACNPPHRRGRTSRSPWTTTHPTAATDAATDATTASADDRAVAPDTRRHQRFRALAAHHRVRGHRHSSQGTGEKCLDGRPRFRGGPVHSS